MALNSVQLNDVNGVTSLGDDVSVSLASSSCDDVEASWISTSDWPPAATSLDADWPTAVPRSFV